MKNGPFPQIEFLEDRIAPAAILVTNTNDSGPGSLRQAIITANGLTGAHTIAFKAGVTGTIKMSAGEMLITNPLTIVGPGAGKILIDAKLNSRVFEVAYTTASNQLPTTISGLALIDGNVYNNASDTGGAILSIDSLNVKNCLISNNRADSGGGVSVLGDVNASIVNSVFTGNTGTDTNNLAFGGAVFLTVKNASISGSRFLDNTGDGGGAIFIETNGNGATLSKSFVIDNSSINGAVELDIPVATGTLPTKVIATVIADNSSSNAAGGLLLQDGNFVVSGSSIIGNSANSQGGGIYSQGSNSVSIVGSKIEGNYTIANSGTASGGGIYFLGNKPVSLSKTTVSGNVSPSGSGGGIFCEAGINITLTGVTLDANRCMGNGAGLDSAGDNVTVIGGIISHNNAGNIGSGLYTTGSGVDKITGAQFLDNVAGASGGALFFSGTVAAEITGSSFIGNQAVNDGGAIFAAQGFLTLKTSLFAHNNAGSSGGAIDISNGVSGNILGTKISGNIAGSDAGGIIQGATGSVTLGAGTTVTANVAPMNPNTDGI